MRQKPTRIFANQPIPTCSGFTCMGCLKRPRGPSGTCHSKAKVPRASIPLNAATSESAQSPPSNFCWYWVISWCHGFVFFRGLLCCLSWGGVHLFIQQTESIYLGCPTTLCRNGNVQESFSGKKNRGEGFKKGKTFCLPELIDPIFVSFCGWKKTFQ